MRTKRGIWTAVFLASIVVLCIAGTKISRITQTTTIQGDSLFLVVTGSQAAGTLETRSIEATNLLSALTNFPGWPASGAGGAATNAISTIKVNGTNVSTAATSLNIIAGTNVTVNATNMAGVVDVRINSSASGSDAAVSNALANYIDVASSNRVRIVGGTGGITVSQSGSSGSNQVFTISDDDAGGGSTTNFNTLGVGSMSLGSLRLTNGASGATLYVDAVWGSDDTGLRGNAQMPFATLTNALRYATNGDTIKIRAGTYSMKATTNSVGVASTSQSALNNRTNMVIEGSGPATVLQYTETGTGISLFNCSNITFRGFSMFGVRSNVEVLSFAIDIRGTNKWITVDDVHFSTWSDHIIAGNSDVDVADYVWIRNSSFSQYGMSYQGEVLPGDGGGVVVCGNYWYISDCLFQDGVQGVELWNLGSKTTGPTWVTGCTFRNMWWHGVVTEGVEAQNNSINVIGNTFYDFSTPSLAYGLTNIGTIAAIDIKGGRDHRIKNNLIKTIRGATQNAYSHGSGIRVYYPSNIRIENNLISDVKLIGIDLDGFSGGANTGSNIVISGNTVVSNGGSGIRVYGGLDVQITDNTVYDNGQLNAVGSTRHGIHVQMGTNVIVRGNVSKNSPGNTSQSPDITIAAVATNTILAGNLYGSISDIGVATTKLSDWVSGTNAVSTSGSIGLLVGDMRVLPGVSMVFDPSAIFTFNGDLDPTSTNLIHSLEENVSPASGDYIMTEEVSTGLLKKVQRANFGSGSGGGGNFNVGQFSSSTGFTNIKSGVLLTNLSSWGTATNEGNVLNNSTTTVWTNGSSQSVSISAAAGVYATHDLFQIGIAGDQALTFDTGNNDINLAGQPYWSLGKITPFDQIKGSNLFPVRATASRAAIIGADGSITNAPAGSAGQYLKQDLTWDNPPGGSATPGGSWGNIQFNSNGVFAGAMVMYTNDAPSLSIGTGRLPEATLQVSNASQASIFIDGVSAGLKRLAIRPHFVGTDPASVSPTWGLGVGGTNVIDVAHQTLAVRPHLYANNGITITNRLIIPWFAKTNAAVINAGTGPNQYANLVVNTNLTDYISLAGSDATNSLSTKVSFTQDSTGMRTLTFMGQTIGVDTNALATTDVEFWIQNGATNASWSIPRKTGTLVKGDTLIYDGTNFINIGSELSNGQVLTKTNTGVGWYGSTPGTGGALSDPTNSPSYGAVIMSNGTNWMQSYSGGDWIVREEFVADPFATTSGQFATEAWNTFVGGAVGSPVRQATMIGSEIGFLSQNLTNPACGRSYYLGANNGSFLLTNSELFIVARWMVSTTNQTLSTNTFKIGMMSDINPTNQPSTGFYVMGNTNGSNGLVLVTSKTTSHTTSYTTQQYEPMKWYYSGLYVPASCDKCILYHGTNLAFMTPIATNSANMPSGTTYSMNFQYSCFQLNTNATSLPNTTNYLGKFRVWQRQYD